MITTELGLCSLHVEANHDHTIFTSNTGILADLTNKSPHALTVPNNKVNVQTMSDMRLIILTIYLFSRINFSRIQLTLKIYFHLKFPDLQ